MHTVTPLLSLLLLTVGLVISLPASAQYTCQLSNGNYVQSNRPCSNNTGLTYYPPITPPPTASTYIPKASPSPDYLQYMSPRCSSMNDAIRTSGVRGLNYQASAELQRNYQRECADDESEARSRQYKERGDARKAEKDAKQ